VLSSTTRSGKRTARLLGALIVVFSVATTLLIPGTAAVAADGDPTVGVATRPAGEDGRPDGRSRFSYSADPGQTVTDRVLVGNTGTERQDFTVFATDAYNAGDGEFALLATDDAPTQIGAWVTFEDGSNRVQFSLDPEEVKLVTFTVTVPADATPGDHAGGLVASVLEAGAQVSLDRRVATAIFTRVSGDLQPRLNVSSFEAVHQGDWWNPFGGTVKILYTVDNPGNVALAANFTGRVVTWFGIPAGGEQGGGVPILLPGNTATFEVELAGVGQWGYLNPSIRLQPFVDTPDEALELSVPPVTRDSVTIAVPWALLILVALAAAVVFFIRWRRRRDEIRAQEWIAYTEQQAEVKAAEAVAAVSGEASTR
jgi:hypothetical protein